MTMAMDNAFADDDGNGRCRCSSAATKPHLSGIITSSHQNIIFNKKQAICYDSTLCTQQSLTNSNTTINQLYDNHPPSLAKAPFFEI
jgi:hypothetical protein